MVTEQFTNELSELNKDELISMIYELSQENHNLNEELRDRDSSKKELMDEYVDIKEQLMLERAYLPRMDDKLNDVTTRLKRLESDIDGIDNKL